MPEINEEQMVLEVIATWLTVELIKCGYPIRSASDVNNLAFAIQQGEIAVVTVDTNKIAIIIYAIQIFIAKFSKCADDIIQAALKLATDLREAAENTMAEIVSASHLEILPN